MSEHHLGYRVRQILNQGLAMDEEKLTRLRAARAQAIDTEFATALSDELPGAYRLAGYMLADAAEARNGLAVDLSRGERVIEEAPAARQPPHRGRERRRRHHGGGESNGGRSHAAEASGPGGGAPWVARWEGIGTAITDSTDMYSSPEAGPSRAYNG